MEGKKVETREHAWDVQDRQSNKPHGWIQWKGTDVCMDVHCKCGKFTHVDGMFVYYVKCPYCGTVYFMNGHIEFIEVEHIDDCSGVTIAEKSDDDCDD